MSHEAELASPDGRRLRERLLGQWGRPKRLRPNRWTVSEVERRIRNEDIEWAYVFDEAGRQVLRRRGTAEGVAFERDEVPLLQDAILVHNHPPYREFPADDPRHDGGSLSDWDLDVAVSYDVAEMRVITSRWRYVVIRPASGWLPDADSLVAAYLEEDGRIRTERAVALEAGRMSERAAAASRAHEIVLRLATWGAFEYRREEL